MESKDLSRKLVSGFLSLTFRRVALLAISFATINFFLARILPVNVIGIFNIANSILAFFTFFSDVGLGAAIIQKKEVSKEDLKTTFTIQEILALSIAVIVWFSAPFLASVYGLDEGGMWLIRALGIGFFLTSLKVIPSVLLERNLRFQPLVWVEILETLTFNALLIFLSLQNYGVAAFAWASLVRGVIGVGTIYLIAPWRMRIGISKISAKTLLTFGVPFQANSILAMLKDRLVPLVIAGIVGSQGVGFISQGQRIAFLPLEIMNIITRVTFPTFSRLQNDPKNLKLTLEKSIFVTAFFLYPMLFGMLAIAPSLVKFLGEEKWGSALPLIYLFSVTAFWATLSSPFTNFLNAIGKVNITLKLMIMWTALEWGLAPIFTIKFGFLGMGISSSLISFTSIIPLIIIKKIMKISIIENIWQPIVASVTMAVFIYYLSLLIPPELPTILILILVGAITYFGLFYLIAKERIKSTFHGVRNALFP